jgi:Outer membrane protein beta-barrel domain
MAVAGVFGNQGQLALSVDLPFNNSAPQFAIVHATQTMGGPSATAIAIAPSLDYFVTQNLSLGGTLLFQYQTQSDQGADLNTTAITILARLGYNIPLGPTASLWPRAGVGYVHASSDVSYGGLSQSATASGSVLIIEMPILYHPAQHFFFGAGPTFQTQLSNSIESGGTSMDVAKTTAYGVEAMIGGYFGGT